ncbi:MAG: hypothetical protein AB7R90_04120 [Reyranellaceae bacterium]
MSEKQNKALAPGRLRPAEAMWRTHAVLVESSLPREAILEPDFWGHVVSRLSPLDRIEVMDDGAAWLAVLLVRAVGEREAVVVPLWSAELRTTGSLSAPAGDDLRPRWGGHKAKWIVVRGETVLREGMTSREAAETWIRSHRKALAA